MRWEILRKNWNDRQYRFRPSRKVSTKLQIFMPNAKDLSFSMCRIVFFLSWNGNAIEEWQSLDHLDDHLKCNACSLMVEWNIGWNMARSFWCGIGCVKKSTILDLRSTCQCHNSVQWHHSKKARECGLRHKNHSFHFLSPAWMISGLRWANFRKDCGMRESIEFSCAHFLIPIHSSSSTSISSNSTIFSLPDGWGYFNELY